MDKKNLGLFSLIGTIASILIMLIINSTFGLIVYILSFILAIFDLVMAYKKENLTPKEFLEVAAKERTLSLVTIFAVIVVICVFYWAQVGELTDALLS